ncbi:putative protein kinase [Leptomonas pyrrhocoris]|uniref:non-specific serine/threonine protein kinase n=1 Tax=Leptomonas pyrrhocoris TaxID=157538 RepID=A0A0N0DQH5_LEPPY|nr:putative protein kinase [Leptomonas pyrrhocoris]KPA73212.1 putative protein kinase [Leptomonas pyrrhocoris]|eukprot:XP_015651651.1 putative protein kinase [Leptomonas pyrrhocoris]
MGMEHYTKVKDLGGTNGAFLARDRQLPDRLVVIKRLADGTQGMEELNAFLRLRHPHVIRFLESFLFDGALYLVMPYEQGGDLDELFLYLKERHKMPTTHTLLLWFEQLLDALAFCHANHVIHRDIKPSNILVSEDTKMLYLADFGSSKTLDTSNVTSTFVGSPLWISPEVLMGTKYSFAADIWSLGCVFYEMATLRKPFSAPSFAHLVQQVTRGQIAPLPPSVASEVREIVQSMLQLHPAERTTAAAALGVARAALAGAEARRNVTPKALRSPIPPANLSPTAAGGRPAPAAPLVLSAPTTVAAPQPTPEPPQPEQAAAADAPPPNAAREPRKSPVKDNGTVPPVAQTNPPPHAASSGVTTPLTNTLDTATPVNSVNGSVKDSIKKADTLPGGDSPAYVVVRKRPAGGTPSPYASAPTKSLSPPPAAEVPAGEEEKSKSSTALTAEPCTPQQMVLNIPTAAFRKPVARKKPTAPRSAALRQPAAPSHQSRPRLQQQQQQRQQVVSLPAPTSGSSAPNFVRQLTADAQFGRRLSTKSAAEVVHEQRNSLHTTETKVVVKAAPPRALPTRAKTAAENASTQRHVPGESPTRAAAAPLPPPPLIGEAERQAPEPGPMVPTKSPAKAAGRVPADQWMEERMRELSAMENYLYQHRVGDDKVLQTYDARRDEEDRQREAAAAMAVPRPPPHRSPAQRRMSPSKAFSSPPTSAGVLVISPPAPVKSQPSQRRSFPVGVSTDPRPDSVASPVLRRASDGRQPSHPGSHTGSRQGSLASTFNGRQASNARPHQPISEEEHQRLEEERAAAREKREAERQRMKELIREQRATAKKQKRKPKKGGDKGAMVVDIVVPDHRRAVAGDAAAATE